MPESAEVPEGSIQTVLDLERRLAGRVTFSERVSDALLRFTGNLAFVAAHIVLFGVWTVVNLGALPVPPFDPFPFGILTLLVSAEGAFLAIFILISQNRMLRQSDQRLHLNLQISLLAERESTKILQMVEALCRHAGIAGPLLDEETRRLGEPTNIATLAETLHEKLKESE
jgi:uncharacterized membrane protein